MAKIVLDDEDQGTPSSNKIVPKAVSKAPAITQQPWDPILGDSVHAYAWWTLTKDEIVTVIREQKDRASKRPASQIAESPPAPKRITAPKGSVAKTPTTTSKKGVVHPPKESSKAKAAAITVPAAPAVKESGHSVPSPESPAPQISQQSAVDYRGSAGIREPSQVSGSRPLRGQGGRHSHITGISAGRGTPSVPPVEAVGYAAGTTGDQILSTPQEPIVPRSDRRPSSTHRSRSRDELQEATQAVPIAPPQAVMTVPNYMLPIMAQAGIGHLTFDQYGREVEPGLPLPSPTGISESQF